MQQIVKGSTYSTKARAHVGENFRLGGGSPEALGFVQFEPKRPAGFMLVIGGVDGTGKTALALTAARTGKPVYLISLSEMSDGDEYMKSLVAKKNVFVKTLSTKEENPLQSEVVAKRVYNETLKVLYALYGIDGIIIVDNVSELYEIGRMAIYGRIEKVPQRDYGAINFDMKSWTHMYAMGGAATDSILISRVSPIYVNGEATAGVDLRGHKEAMYQCAMAVCVQKTIRDDKGAIVPQKDKFSATVLRCKARNTLEGLEIRGEDLDFARMKAMAYGGSK